jgi:hypothetical protein
MLGASEPSKVLDVRTAPLQVLRDLDPAVSESEQEPTPFGSNRRHPRRLGHGSGVAGRVQGR